jgi:hypothetical protein
VTTLLALRQALGHEVDDLEVHTVTGAGANTVTVADLVDASTGASALQHAGDYLYAQTSGGSSLGQQVRVRVQGFTPSTGALAFDPAWSAPPVGAALEITSKYPVLPLAGAQQSCNGIVNRGLSKMVTQRRVNVTIAPGTAYALLSAFPWLDRPERVLAVYEPSIVTGGNALDADWRRPRLVVAPNHVALLTVDSAPAGGMSLIVDALAPVSSYVYTVAGGVWAESTAGLVLDTDEADVSVEDAMPFLRLEWLAPLVERARGVPTGTYAEAYKDALSACEASRFFDQTARRPQPQQQQAAPQPTAVGVA